jgi:hypothetical protein
LPDPALAAAQAEVAALKGLLLEIVPPQIIDGRPLPPEGDTTIFVPWEWFHRARAALVRP